MMTFKTYLKNNAETPSAFARRSGVSKATVSRILSGKTEWPSKATVQRFVTATGGKIGVRELLAGNADC